MKDAKEYAESIGAIVVETSAKNAINIEELFQGISKYIYKFLVDVVWSPFENDRPYIHAKMSFSMKRKTPEAVVCPLLMKI